MKGERNHATLHEKVVFFDLFNTLVRPPDQARIKEWLKKRGDAFGGETLRWLESGFAFALVAEELEVPFAVLRDELLVRDFADVKEMIHFAETLAPHSRKTSEYAKEFTEDYLNFIISNTTLYEGVTDLLAALKRKGYAVFLLSNLISPYKKLISRHRLVDWVQAAFLSCEMGCKKPDSRFFHEALAKCRVNGESAWMVGDNWRSDIMGGCRVNMKLIFVDRQLDPLASHLAQHGLAGLLQQDQGKIVFKREYRTLLEERIPIPLSEIESDLLNHVYVDGENKMRLKCLRTIHYAKNLEYLLNVI